MNALDWILVGIVFVYAVIGFATGMLSQVCGLLGIILSLFLGYIFYAKTGNLLLLPVVIIGTAVAFKILLYLIRLVYFSVRKAKPTRSFLSRMAGGIIASCKGLAFAYIGLICLYLLATIFTATNPAIIGYAEGSLIYSYCVRHNLLPGTKIIERISKATSNQEVFSNLKNNPSFRAILDDTQLQQYLRNKDYKKVFQDPEFRNLLKDKDFLRRIYSIDYEDAYKYDIE